MMRPIAGFYGIQGRFDEGRAVLAEARAIFDELGRTIDAQTMAFWSGPLELLAGELQPQPPERPGAPARRWRLWASGAGFRPCRRSTRMRSTRRGSSTGPTPPQIAAGKPPQATTTTHSRSGRAVKAKVLARRGDFDEAERVAEEAIASVDRSDELNNRANVRTDAAEALQLAGRTDRAVVLLQEALAQFEQKGNVVMSERTRALLDDLGAPAPPPA